MTDQDREALDRYALLILGVIDRDRAAGVIRSLESTREQIAARLVELEKQLARCEALEARGRWTPTATALPADGQEVLVWIADGAYPDMAHWNGEWWECGGWYPREWATHWMTLPPGPEPEGEAP